MSWKPEVDQIERRRELAAQLGGPEAVEKQHARGRLTVRERIDTLVDAGVARSRSEALSWAVKLVGEHTESWLADLRTAMQEVDKFTRRRLRSILAKYNRKKGSHRMIDNRKYNKAYFTDLGFFSLEEAWKLEFQSLRSKH